MSKCRYCDGWNAVAGGSCRNSPTKTHVVVSFGKCMYCDGWNAVAGGSCGYSPTKTHIVDAGSDKCIYCDGWSVAAGGSCRYSPTNTHVMGILDDASTFENKVLNEKNTINLSLLWISILFIFLLLTLPTFYLLDWDLDTPAKKILLIAEFIFSFYVGLKFSDKILKVILSLVMLIFFGLVSLFLISWIFGI